MLVSDEIPIQKELGVSFFGSQLLLQAGIVVERGKVALALGKIAVGLVV